MTVSTARPRASRYLFDAVDPTGIRRIVKEATAQLRLHLDEFDGIAVKGLSGLLVGPIVALRLRKPLIAVRDPKVPTHADCKVEAGITKGRYLIFDDITRTGNTIDTIMETIAKHHPALKPVALYLYREDTLLDPHETALPIWHRLAKVRHTYPPRRAQVTSYVDQPVAA